MKKSDFEKFLRSPTLFAIHVLKIRPFKYQVKILEDENKRILMVCGRGVGKTTVLAIKALWNAFVKPEYEVLIVAPTLRQSRIMYETIRKLIYKNKYIHRKANVTLHETRFDNESVIRIVPVGEKGDIARGFHPDMLIFDEAAFMPDEAILAIEPSVLPKDGIIIYSSTPYGMNNRFYELYRLHRNDWSVYQIPSWECPLAKADFLEEMRKSMPEVHFMQEYGAQFVSEVGMLYPYNLVLNNAKDYEYLEMYDKPCVMGVDVSGGGQDEHAIVIVREDEFVDLKVLGDRRRMARIPHTYNSKSGMWVMKINPKWVWAEIKGRSRMHDEWEDNWKKQNVVGEILKEFDEENGHKKNINWDFDGVEKNLSIVDEYFAKGDRFPPCIEAWMKELEMTGELDHVQRFNLGLFLLHVWGYEKTLDYFRKYANDFKERYTSYQLKYMIRRKLKMYRCERLKEMGLCEWEKCPFYPTLNAWVRWR